MSRWMLLALSTLLLAASHASAQVVVEDFSTDPSVPHPHSSLFEILGPGSARFQYDDRSAARFAGDPRGSLSAIFDSAEPTVRYATTFAGGFTEADDFVFGAILTIRPEGFAADPFGFHPIALTLFNSSTTGPDRTGDSSDFRADTFDTVEFSYFPNVSPLFGGPWVSADVFGAPTDADAFSHFAFFTASIDLTPGTPYLVEMIHSAGDRRLTARIAAVDRLGRAAPVGETFVDLSAISGFLVDSLGIAAYRDGFNEYAPSGHSLLATVDFDLLYCARLEEGEPPAALGRILKRLKRRARVQAIDPGLE